MLHEGSSTEAMRVSQTPLSTSPVTHITLIHQVFVRMRPLTTSETAQGEYSCWNFNDTSILDDTQNGQGQKAYTFDRCFGPNATNQDTFDIVGQYLSVYPNYTNILSELLESDAI